MSRSSKGALGAMHPILFFCVVYGIAAALVFFIGNTVYSSMNSPADVAMEKPDVKPSASLLVEAKPGAAFR